MARKNRRRRPPAFRGRSQPRLAATARCPCHSGQPYGDCCKPLHDGDVVAERPLQLMRSRYAAYALGHVDYIMDTTDPDGPHHQADRGAWGDDLREFTRATRFESLDILGHGDTPEPWVTFRAGLRQGDDDASFTERSVFRQLDGRWVYVEGTPVS